jgi:hypothetical protein
MKVTTTTLILGAVVAFLGILGLVSGEGKIAADSMNIDLMLDITRLALGAILVVGALRSLDATRTALTVFGAAYLGVLVLGLLTPTLFGLLPHGLGMTDQILHAAGGMFALYLARSYSHNKAAL